MAKEMKHDTNTAQFVPFTDLTRMLEQFKVPGGDMSSFVEARRKDIEAVVEANRQAYEAMQALARTQTDILTQAVQSMQEAAKGMTAAGAAIGDPVKQAEVAGQAWHKLLDEMKGLAERVQKTQADAVADLNQRVADQMKSVQQKALAK